MSITRNSLRVLVVPVCVLALAAGCPSSSDESDAMDGSRGPSKPGARIYVTLAGDDEVISIDDDTHEILSHIPTGQGPAIILSTPDHAQLYTANWEDNSVTVIDVASEKPKTISLPGRPYVIAMAPNGDFVYAGLNNKSIAVISTKTKAVDKYFPTKILAASIIVSPDGAILYVASLAGLAPGNLGAMHADTGEVAWETITVGAAPAWITMTPDGETVYTLNFLSDSVSVVRTTPWEVTTTVSTGKGSQAIIGNVTPDGSRLYVTNHGTGELMAIDTTTNKPVQTIKLDGRPVGVNFNTDGSRVYVGDFGKQSLSYPADTNFLLTGKFSTMEPGQVNTFDTKTGKRIGKPVAVGPGPTSIVFVPE